MDEAVLNKVLIAHEKITNKNSAAFEPDIRSKIMKSPITKLAAAVIIIVVILGLVEFIDTESNSGIVWAEVAKKVETSRGVICRGRDVVIDSRDGGQDGGPDYTMNYLANTKSRYDSYEGDQIIKTFYDDYNTKTVVFIDHVHKSYIKKILERMEQNDLWRDPKSLVQKFLSHEHRELGQNTVEGVLCEGIETTDPSFDETNSNFTVDSLKAQLWVSVETDYPVLLEFEVIRTVGDNEKVHIKAVMDQFQWDVELDESIFEPNIPAGYMQIPMP
jgi:hypothetical protein